jgi:Txe/YoeB family toxin of toxin-antitoxin system
VSPHEIRFTKEAAKDFKKLPPRLKDKLKEILLNQIAVNPYKGKRLAGDLLGFYSVRLTYKDRIVYSVDEARRIVFVHRTRTHYGD